MPLHMSPILSNVFGPTFGFDCNQKNKIQIIFCNRLDFYPPTWEKVTPSYTSPHFGTESQVINCGWLYHNTSQDTVYIFFPFLSQRETVQHDILGSTEYFSL